MIQLTNEILQQARSRNGGWSAKQVALLGQQFGQLERGWQMTLIGRYFPETTIEQFIALKDAHLKHKKARRIKIYPAPKQCYVAQGLPSPEIVAECPFDLSHYFRLCISADVTLDDEFRFLTSGI